MSKKQRQISCHLIDVTKNKVTFETNQNHEFPKGQKLCGKKLNYNVVEVITPYAYKARVAGDVNDKKVIANDLSNGFVVGWHEAKKGKKVKAEPSKAEKKKVDAESQVSFKLEEIAKHCHEANKKYCESIGDDSQPSWDDAPDWQKESAINGVRFHLANPEGKPEDSHNSWLEQKEKDGWVYGEVKAVAKKTHPCMVPYDKLPKEQQEKDKLFIATVKFHTKNK